MIKLVEILKGKPKAIFLAGPAGSGKSTFVKQFLSDKGLTSINIDDVYEPLLKQAGLDKPQSQYTGDELSQSAKLMAQARKEMGNRLAKSMEDLQSIIIDGTGAAANPIRKKKQALEELGYETFMVMVYVSPLTSLERNAMRDRQLRPSVLTRTWNSVIANIDEFRNMFGNDIVVIDNDPQDAIKTYDEDAISKYFDQVTYTGKEEDPVKLAKKQKEKEELTASIKRFLENPPQFDSPQEIQSKIDEFLS